MIEVASVSKRFGTINALKNVSFQVEKGEIVGLLGRNGAGKTTMLRILACFSPPLGRTGEHCRFEPGNRLPGGEKKNRLFSGKTSRLSGNEGGRISSVCGQAEGRCRGGSGKWFSEVMAVCGLGGVRRWIIGNLSRGYQTRIGLAQALLGEPEVLLLDEPTVGLDPEQIIEIRDLIKGLAGRKTIILFHF